MIPMLSDLQEGKECVLSQDEYVRNIRSREYLNKWTNEAHRERDEFAAFAIPQHIRPGPSRTKTLTWRQSWRCNFTIFDKIATVSSINSGPNNSILQISTNLRIGGEISNPLHIYHLSEYLMVIQYGTNADASRAFEAKICSLKIQTLHYKMDQSVVATQSTSQVYVRLKQIVE